VLKTVIFYSGCTCIAIKFLKCQINDSCNFLEGYTLNAVNNYDENLLHISAANGCLGIVREILDQKENRRVIDRKNKFGWTPLMQAIRNGNIDTVKLLLERKADVNQMTYLGKQVFMIAVN